MRAQEVTAAEGRTPLRPRGGPRSQAEKPSPAACRGTRSQPPALRTPPPSLCRARSAAAPVRSRGIRPREAGPTCTQDPGPPPPLLPRRSIRPSPAPEERRGLAGRPDKAGCSWPRPGPARARGGAEPGQAFAPALSRRRAAARRLLRLQLGGDAFLRRRFPRHPQLHSAPDTGASLPSGKEDGRFRDSRGRACF